MNGDFSRWTFKAAKHYAAVLEQQGRVTTDPDWNEAVAIGQHLRETTTSDVIGFCGVPKHGGGFEIGVVTDPNADPQTNLSITPGRIYVDGILCELERSTSQDGTTLFTEQPYLIGAELNPEDGHTDLVYLDVWRRHVTVIEDPELREVALGGPDTTTRLQTVWQVKILPDVGSASCGSTITAWDELINEPERTLTASLDPAQPDQPCSVTPGGGYGGVANHLYRIEIHDPEDDSNAATFKWSRDNGSIVAAVEAFPVSNKVKVARLGWGDVLAFHTGDQVEVLDDIAELAGIPGTLAEITHIDTANRVLTLDTPVTTYDITRHARVRRWDHGGPAVEVQTGVPIELEHGLSIQFDGSGFRTGEHWLVAARVGDGNQPGALVDAPVQAPPLGIRHHYCRLALVTWAEQSSGVFEASALENCAPEFPPLTELPAAGAGCCTVTVGDGVHSTGDYSDIQDAINAAGPNAHVCILPGEYQLQETLTIPEDGLTLSACGRGARIIAPSGAPALQATSRWRVHLLGLHVEAASPSAAVRIESCEPVWIVDCLIENLDAIAVSGAPSGEPAGPAVFVAGGEKVHVHRNFLSGTPALSVQAEDLEIVENVCAGGGIWIRDGSSAVRVTGNRIGDGGGPGIGLGGLAQGEEPAGSATGVTGIDIAHNLIRAMTGSGISTLVPDQDQPALGDVEGLEIHGNRITGCARADEDAAYDEESIGGIVLRNVSRVTIHDNTIVDNGSSRAGPGCGVFVHTCRGLEISANRIVNNGSSEPGDDRKPYQAGIVAFNIWEDEPTTVNDAELAVSAVGAGLPAARIHGNTVHCPKGQALILVALGPISVAGNSFSSEDAYAQQLLPHAALGVCVFIWNFGQVPGVPAAGLGTSVTVHSDAVTGTSAGAIGTAATDYTPFPDGRVLFHGNHVTLRLPAEGGAALPAVALVSFGDAAVNDNQIQSLVTRATPVNVLALASSMRLTDNRIAELPGRAAFSYYGLAGWHVATGNQATHCLLALGSNVAAAQNQIMIPSAFCQRA